MKHRPPRAPALLLALVLTVTVLCGSAAPVRANPLIRKPEKVLPAFAPTDTSPALPADTTPAVPTDDELIAQYALADDWARPALLFAVRKGLLTGRSANVLAPTEPTTRAELAAILMRLLRTETAADLSQFTDADSSQWYYPSLSRAVAAGLLSGTSQTTLAPNGKLTREQAFTVLARAFGITGGDRFTLYRFDDVFSIGDWAADALAAMVEAGYVNGSDGRLNPKGVLSRQELAQVFFNLLTDISDTVPAAFTGTLATNAATLAPGTVIQGDLILCGEQSALTLTQLTVTGRLVLQGCGALALTLNECSIGELVLCRPTDVQANGGIAQVHVLHAGATLSGSYDTLLLDAAATLNGAAQELVLNGGNFTLAQGATVEQLTVQYTARDTYITLDGDVQTMLLDASGVKVAGAGSIDALTMQKDGCEVTCARNLEQQYPVQSLAHVQLSRAEGYRPSPDYPWAKLGVSFAGVTQELSCRLLWFADGKLLHSDPEFLLTPDAKAELVIDFTSYMDTHAQVELHVLLLYQDETAAVRFPVLLDNGVYTQAEQIRTMDVPATLNYSVGFYSRYGQTYLRTLPAGTLVYYKEASGSQARVMLQDGTQGWVDRYAVSVHMGDYYVTWDYSKAAKECYVNLIRKLSSKTSYLIWVNLYTQRVNIFQGTTGNWRLIRECRVATGLNNMLTVDQLTEIRYKTRAWYFDASEDYVHHVSVIDYAGRAFHSRLFWTKDGTLKDGTLGKPASHGCIRMEDEDCLFIYNSIPVGTAVLVY